MEKATPALSTALRQLGDEYKHSAPQTYVWRSVRLTYVVGEGPEGDRVEHSYELTADTTVFFIDQWVGVTPECSRVDDLAAIGLAVQTPDREAVLLPVGEPTGRRFAFRIHLVPPVLQGQTARIDVSYHWRGAWDPLRKCGLDSGLFTLTHPASHLELRVVTPGGSLIDLAETLPEGARMSRRRDDDEHEVLIAEWDDIQIGQLRFTLARATEQPKGDNKKRQGSSLRHNQ